MGFISFVVLLITQFYPSLSTDMFHMFEISHLWIFIMAVMFVLNATVLVVESSTQVKRWYRHNARDIRETLQNLKPAKSKWYIYLFGRTKTEHSVEFAFLRQKFLEVWSELDVPDDFHYGEYLRTCLDNRIGSQVVSHTCSYKKGGKETRISSTTTTLCINYVFLHFSYAVTTDSGLHIQEVAPFTWGVLAGILFLNVIRSLASNDYGASSDYNAKLELILWACFSVGIMVAEYAMVIVGEYLE